MTGTTSAHEQRDLRHVERQHPVDVLERVILDLDAAQHAAGVVDEDVDPSVRRHCFGDDPLDVGLLHDIAAGQHHLRAQGLDVGRHRFGGIAARVVMHDDPAALLRERARRGCADAGGRPGDEDYLVFQIRNHVDPLAP
jgi:hypothetical protein